MNAKKISAPLIIWKMWQPNFKCKASNSIEACVTWDGDFKYSPEGWECFSFVGSRWNTIRKEERKLYLKNAYRVLLTRARQGMVIVGPEGDHDRWDEEEGIL